MIGIEDLWRYELRRGKTDHPRSGACLFDAGMWLVYGRVGDDPPCSCPIIRAYAIGLNDSMLDAERQMLKPFILRVVGNRDPSAEAARLKFIVLETARRVVPLTSDLPQFAALRSLPDDASYEWIKAVAAVARDVAAGAVGTWGAGAADAAAGAAAMSTWVAADSARIVAAAADSAAAPVSHIVVLGAGGVAAHVARIAGAAARATASAANAARIGAFGAAEAIDAEAVALGAADAVADAADAAARIAARIAGRAAAASRTDARAVVWREAIGVLDGALRIGRQSPEFDEAEVRDSIARFEAAALETA